MRHRTTGTFGGFIVGTCSYLALSCALHNSGASDNDDVRNATFGTARA